jgi:hypothetical protein
MAAREQEPPERSAWQVIRVRESDSGKGEQVMMRAKLAAVAAVLGLPLLVTPAAEASPSSASTTCSSGAVCVYNGTSESSGINQIFWSYGGHNLINQYGKKLVINNQYGSPSPWMYLCAGYNGTGNYLGGNGGNGQGGIWDLTPVNSIVLARPGGYPADVSDGKCS